jgi:anaerobic selenocysteine-containing dehydrogenase
MQRVHGGGNAVRLIALLPCLVGAWRHRAGGLLLSASGWFRAVRNDAALQRPDLLAGRAAAHHQHEHHRRRPAAPGLARLRPAHRGGGGLQQQPGGGGAREPQGGAGFAREDLFTVVLEHFLTDTADHADYVLPATTQLEHWDVHASYGHTYVLVNEPAVAPLGQARTNAEIFRRWPRAWASPSRASPTATRRWRAWPSAPRWSTSTAARARLGQAADARGAIRRRRLPHADGKAIVDAPGLGVPDHVPNHECARATPELARASRWR